MLANQTSVTPDACPPPHSQRAGGTATGRFSASRGAGRGGQEAIRSAATAPDALKLTRGHGRAGQAGVAGRCHLRAPRASLLAQPLCGRRRRCPRPAARSLRGPQPMAKSWGRAESTSLRTLPALPAPPDDALLPPLFICGFRPSPRLCTLFSGCPGVGGSGRRPRGCQDKLMGAPAGAPQPSAPQCANGTRAPGRPLTAPPTPPRNLPWDPASVALLRGAGAKAAGDRQTERPPPSPSALTPLARTQRKQRRRQRSGAGSATAGLTAPVTGAGGDAADCRVGAHSTGSGPQGARETAGGRGPCPAPKHSEAPRVCSGWGVPWGWGEVTGIAAPAGL